MIRTSPGRSGSEYWTLIRTPSSFIFDAPMQNSNVDAYHMVRYADPDADAGSVVRCCAVPHLTTVPVRGRVSILKPGTASFLKLKCKNVHGSTQRRRGSVFLLKISCLNFSKAVGCDANPDPDPWVWISKKIHQNRKCK
jgi:hypothetical protein